MGNRHRAYYIQWLRDNRQGIQYGAVLVGAIWLCTLGLWVWGILVLVVFLPLITPPPSAD